jgi:hypothetical protein
MPTKSESDRWNERAIDQIGSDFCGTGLKIMPAPVSGPHEKLNPEIPFMGSTKRFQLFTQLFDF